MTAITFMTPTHLPPRLSQATTRILLKKRLRTGLRARLVAVAAAASVAMVLAMGGRAAHAQASSSFVYGITSGGVIYEIDLPNKTTTQAFTTNLNYMNGLAFYEGGDGGNGQLFYRAGTSATNGSTDLYLWNRRTNTQALVAVSTSIVPAGKLAGQSSNASWYGGAYWYVDQGKNTLYKATLDLSNVAAPFVSSVSTFTSFDGGKGTGTYSFGDISISSSGVLYGSTSNRFFEINVSSGVPDSSTFKETVTAAGSQLQIGFGAGGAILYGEAAGSGEWFQVDKSSGARTALGFTSAATFNDISEGSLRSAGAVVTPEPSSLALLALLAPLAVSAGCRVRRRRTA